MGDREDTVPGDKTAESRSLVGARTRLWLRLRKLLNVEDGEDLRDGEVVVEGAWEATLLAADTLRVWWDRWWRGKIVWR